MKPALFGTMPVSTDSPRVVGTLFTLEALEEFPGSGKGYCDIAEARLDQIGHENDRWISACDRIQNGGTPVLLTLRTIHEGGKSALSQQEQRRVVKDALSTVSAVDFEHKRVDRELISAVKNSGKAIVSSFHDFSGTPSLAELTRIVEEAATYADVVKLSTFVHSAEDVAILRQVLVAYRNRFPICVIGMGSQGTCTRKDFPAEGSCLTYGYLDVPSAPGQISAADLKKHVSATLARR